MKNSKYLNTDLFILGTGIQFPEQLTLETIDVISGCKAVFTNIESKKIDSLPAEFRENIVSLYHLYVDGRTRIDNYRDVTSAILNELKDQKPIGWLTQGHPVIFDRVTSNLLKEARELGYRVNMLSGISSIDTLLTDIEYEPANGLFIYEATGLVRNNILINTSCGVMLLQPSVFNSDVAHLTLSGQKPSLLSLQEYLLQFYPKDHKCAFVRSFANINGDSQIYWLKISEIHSTPVEIVAGSTLWINRIE